MIEAVQFGSLDFRYSTREISPLDSFVMLRDKHFLPAGPSRMREPSQRSKEVKTRNAAVQSKALEKVFDFVEQSRGQNSRPALKTIFDIYQTSVLGSKKPQIIQTWSDRDRASQQTCLEWKQALMCVKANIPIPFHYRLDSNEFVALM